MSRRSAIPSPTTSKQLRRAALLLPLLAAAATSLVAQNAPPSTDIFVAHWEDLEIASSEVTKVVRVTDRAGYDNQPAFLQARDGHALRLAFTSGDADGGTEILAYSFETGKTETLISTPQKEYSPTQVPGEAAVSVIRDYGNEIQQLWSFTLTSKSAGEESGSKFLLPDINPVGYHAWTPDGQLLLFVLGGPPTLRLAAVGPGPGRVLAENPGRSLKRIPDTDRMAFVHKIAEGEWWITAVDTTTGKLEKLFPTLEATEDFAISPNGAFWMGQESRLYRRTADDEAWKLVVDLGSEGIKGITRLAWDNSGSRLAIVSAR